MGKRAETLKAYRSDLQSGTRVCKACAIQKPFIHRKTYGYKVKAFVDDDGKKWNGKICYDCHRKDKKTLYRLKTLSVPRYKELVFLPNGAQGKSC